MRITVGKDSHFDLSTGPWNEHTIKDRHLVTVARSENELREKLSILLRHFRSSYGFNLWDIWVLLRGKEFMIYKGYTDSGIAGYYEGIISGVRRIRRKKRRGKKRQAA